MTRDIALRNRDAQLFNKFDRFLYQLDIVMGSFAKHQRYLAGGEVYKKAMKVLDDIAILGIQVEKKGKLSKISTLEIDIHCLGVLLLSIRQRGLTGTATRRSVGGMTRFADEMFKKREATMAEIIKTKYAFKDNNDKSYLMLSRLLEETLAELEQYKRELS